jgi:branched-chain amino acid transport system permease protein
VKTALAVIAAAALLPLGAGEYYVNLASQIVIFAVFAASINLLLGYGGLPTLGHAAYLGVGAYLSALLYLKLHLAHWAIAPIALAGTTLMAGVFGIVALRATGLGFLMLTLALSQVLWGTAYRWVSMTDGDNGLRGLARPAPFGFNLNEALPFYYFVLAIGVLAVWMMARFVASPFGATLRGTRDQPRRMSALGYDVWLIRWITFVYAGFWGAVSGLLFVYYHKYIHPVSLSLANSAEGLLAVIAGGSGTLAGPLVGAAIVLLLKNLVSAYIERWNMLLGFVFVVIVVFMPEGLGPGIRRWWREPTKYRVEIAFALAPMAPVLAITVWQLVARNPSWDFVLVWSIVVTYGVMLIVAAPAYAGLREYVPFHWTVCVGAGLLSGVLVWIAQSLMSQPLRLGNLGPLSVLCGGAGVLAGFAYWLIVRGLSPEAMASNAYHLQQDVRAAD